MIIVKKISTIFDLIDGGVPISSFNLGNVSKKDNTKSVTKSVFLSQNEIDRILDLEKKGVLVTAQMVPMEETVSFSDFYGKDE
ncbi:PTS sugar transporter subunit IIB [Enterococcus cecorum]|nr:PTS sugar transporter subunit IIB [Enterococcus cecorum]